MTVISTAPDPAGEIAVILESEFIEKELAGFEPKRTVEVPVNPLPVIMTAVPEGPLAGETPVITGAVCEVAGVVEGVDEVLATAGVV